MCIYAMNAGRKDMAKNIITTAMRCFTNGKATPRMMWALTLLPMPADPKGNEFIMNLLLDAVARTSLSIAQVLDQESGRPIPKWLPTEFARIIPNYRQFLRMLDRLGDGGAFERKLAKYEEELLYQAHYSALDEITKDANRETRKTEFSMRLKMTGQLMKRRKDKGEATVVDEAASESALKTMSNEQLLELSKMVTVEGAVDENKE